MSNEIDTNVSSRTDEEIVPDPWNLLRIWRPSEHCEGKIERIYAYDHTGWTIWKCECGHEIEEG